MWDEINLITQRVDKLLERAMYLERLAQNIMDIAHDVAIEANKIKYMLYGLDKYKDDLK